MSDIGCILNFIDRRGKRVRVNGDMYAIKLIKKSFEVYWLEYPITWGEEVWKYD